jgi:hypothetical protein
MFVFLDEESSGGVYIGQSGTVIAAVVMETERTLKDTNLFLKTKLVVLSKFEVFVPESKLTHDFTS